VLCCAVPVGSSSPPCPSPRHAHTRAGGCFSLPREHTCFGRHQGEKGKCISVSNSQRCKSSVSFRSVAAIFPLASMSRAYDSSEGRVDGPNPNASGENAPLLIDARRAQMCTFAEIAGQRRDAETPGFAECEFPGMGGRMLRSVDTLFAHASSAGWNGLQSLTFKALDLAEPDAILEKHQKLGQYMATPIAGDMR
jgi:hypothetical protein